MTLAERIAAELHRVSTDRYMFGLFGDGRMGSGGFGKLQILGKTKHVTRCQNCGRAGLKHAVVCAVVGEDGHPTNQYYYFGTDCAARLAGKAEKDVEAEAEHQESSGRPRMKNIKPAKPNEGQMELGLRFAAYLHDLITERYARAKASKGQMGFDFDALASAPQSPAPVAQARPAASEPPALPVKGKQMGLFDQPEQPKTVASGNATKFDEEKHPRWEAGDKQHHGGQFAPKESKSEGVKQESAKPDSELFADHFKNGRVSDVVGLLQAKSLPEAIKIAGDFGLPVYNHKSKGELLRTVQQYAEANTPEKRQAREKKEKAESAYKTAKTAFDNAMANKNGLLGAPINFSGSDEQFRNPHAPENRDAIQAAWREEVAKAFSELDPEHADSIKLKEDAALHGLMPALQSQEVPKPQYFKGDQIRLTGKTDGDFEEFEYLEGHKKGQTGLRLSPAASAAQVEQRKQEWKDQQAQFARLHQKQEEPKAAQPAAGQQDATGKEALLKEYAQAVKAHNDLPSFETTNKIIELRRKYHAMTGRGASLDDDAKPYQIHRPVKEIEKDIAKIQQRLDTGNANRPKPLEGGTRARSTTFNANQGKNAELLRDYKSELKNAQAAAGQPEQEAPKAAEKSEPHLEALRGLVGDEHYNKIAGEFDRAFKEFDTLPQDKKDLEYRANQTRSKALQTELGAKVTYAGLRVGLLGDGMEKLVRGMKQGEQKPELPAQPKAAEPAAPSQPAAPASNPQYQWGPDVVSVEPGNTAPHQKRAEGMAYALAEGVYAAKTGTVHAGNTPEALRKRITQIDAINDAISKAGGTPHAYNKAGVLAEIDKLEAGAGNPSGVQMAQYIPPTRGEQVSGIFNPQPAQSMPAASGGAVAPESQPAESVGSRVAAAITKRSMDFGRKVEVRKDRAKSTGPKAKKQVGEWDLDEGWAKRYQITQVASSKDPSEVGKFIITDKKQKGPWYAKDQGVQVGGQYSSAEEAKQALPLIEVARNHRVYEGRDGKWHIYRKLGDRHHVSVKSFPSQEEAMKYMAMNPREIIGHKFPRYETYQYLTEVERKGPERRKGTVNEQDFQKAFAPGGAVFGNWMTNKDGVTAFHHAYDSLHDLADVLDLHPHQVSIDGDLVFGFGAAGSGGKDAARAHYEPGQRLINLTKMAGAGSLAHEWWHALEHHIAKKLGASEHTAVNLRPSAMKNDPELAAAVEELHDAMHYSNDEGANKAELQRVAEAQERRKQKLADTNREARENGTTVYDPQGPEDFLHNIRLGMQRTLSYKKKEAKPELMKQYEEIESKLKAGDLGERAGSTTHGFVPIYANIQALSDLHKKITGRGLLAKDAEGDKWLRRIYWDNLKLEKPKTEAAKVENKPKRTVRSKFKIEADKLDHSRSSPYYGLPHEMAARAFEAYVEDKLKKKGIQSDYLVGQGKTDSAFYKAFGLDAPFPEGDERKQINAAFDKLLAAVRKHLRKPETERHSLVESAEQLNRRVRQLVVEKFGANELVPEQPKPQQPTAAPALAGQVDSHPHWETPEFKNWFGGSHVKTPEGKPLRVFHGTKRPDRIQNFFNPKRATSGPMAFFTDNPEIASSYATSKQDTSLEMPESYSQWFKYKVPGSKREVDLDSAWYHLPAEQRKNALERLPHVNTNEDGVISHQHGQGTVASDWDWYLKREGGGNPLKAARHLWLDSGHLYSDESRFLEVLKHAGIDHTQFRMESPWHEQPGVYPVHLSIQNPLDTGNIPEHVHNALQQAGKRKRGSAGGGADQWDKRHVSGPDWLQRLAEDRQNGTAHAWTSIPDWVTKTLMAHGYDGIKDSGGKGGGTPHNVWIPFRSHQVKSAIGNRGSYSLDNKRINHSAESAVERYSGQSETPESLEQLQANLEKQYPALKMVASERPSEVHLHQIEVAKESRGQGIGRMVMERLKGYAQKAGKPITLHAEPEKGKKGALNKFYQSAGFSKVGRNRDYRLAAGHTHIWRPEPNKPSTEQHRAVGGVERYSAAHGFEELLARAAKYRVKGQGYNRNIHTSASRLDDMLSQGRHKEAAHWADELRLRLDALEPQPAKPATDLLGQPVKPAPKPKAVFDSTKGKQQTLFAGLNAKEGQMNLFADSGVPDELVAKPQQPAQKELFSAVREALVERYAAQQSPWFLRSARVLAEKMGQHAPASQVLATLRNNQVSPEELKWTGLEKHLLGKGNQPVSQRELHDLIGQFNVGEKVLGDRGHSAKLRKFIEETGWREDVDGQLHDYLWKHADHARKNGLDAASQEYIDLGNEAWSARQKKIQEPKYKQYALPGGNNYREMLLTLPSQKPEMRYKTGSDIRAKAKEFQSFGWHPEAIEEAAKFVDEAGGPENGLQMQGGLISRGYGFTTHQKDAGDILRSILRGHENRINDARKGEYHSGHWDDPNVLAHVRYQDFIGPDGKKHLHIDEIQSDWHQQGRKQGYSSNREERDDAAEQIKNLLDQQQQHHPNSEQWNAINEQIIPLGVVANGGGPDSVPNAPFKNNWHMLAMKRMMHHAAANGYDRVTWTPGEEHASRYDLQKHLRAIHHDPYDGKIEAIGANGYEKPVLSGHLKDGKFHAGLGGRHKEFHGKDLSDIFGKDIAERITSYQGKAPQTITGEGLKAGGSGMRKFYDQMLPNDTNKLIKKHGGKVGQFDLHVHDQFHDSDGMPTSTAPRAMKVHGFDVTPSMKAEAAGGKGQSMFSVYEDADWRVERYEQAGDRQPKFRIDAGMKAAAQPTPPSTKPPAIFGAIGGLASKAGNWLQDKADKVAGKIGGAAQKLDQKGQAAMAKVGLADKAAAPAKPKSAGVKAGAPLMFNGDHSINGGQTSIPKGTQGKLVGPHQDPKNVVVDVGGQHHVVPKSLLLHDLRHTDHKAVEKSKQEAQQAQADQQAKVRQMTARQRAEAVPEGADKAKLKNMNIGSHELQVGDVVNHSTPGLHPYGRVLEVSPDGKKIKIEEAARSKNAPGGIATTGRHVWIDGHEKIGDTGAVGTRSFPVLRTPDEYRPIGERKEYKEAYEGAKKLGLNDDQAHEMAMQMWDDLQAKNNPKPQPAPAAQQPAQAQPQAAQAKPAGAPKPRHHAESLQAGDTLRMLKGSDTGTNLKFIGRSKQPGMVEVEHPTLGRQTFRSRDLGLYVPGQPKAAGPSFTDQMKKGYDRSSPDMHTVKRSEFAGQKHGVLAKDQQGRGFLLYGGKKFALQPNEFDGQKLIGDNAGVKIRERIHREQIQALASKDPSAVPAHVREEYDHHWDKWSGNSSFAKSGGKPAKGPAQVPQEPKRAATLIGMPLNTPAGKAGVGRLTPVEQRSPLEDPALQEQIQERAAIMEHEGGYDPQSALRLAIRDAARRFKPSQPLPQVSVDAQPARADSRIQPGQKASNPARLEGQKAALNRSLLEDAGQAQQPKAIFLGRDQFRNALQSPPSRVRTGTPAQPPAPIDEEAAERAAIQAEGNQVTPEGQAASPPPTQPAGAASAPSGVNPQVAQRQSPNLRALVRPFQAGRNMATMQFADDLQRDLHDYAAAQVRRRQFSGKAGRQQPRQAAQLESTLNRIAAEHFGGDKDAAHLAALQTLAHVKAHMRGVGDGQHKVIPPTSAGLPAEPKQPATATGTNTGRLTKLPQNPTPRQAEQHVNTMVNRHMREFAAREAMHAQKLVNAWKVYREKMGIPADRRFKGARDLKEALAQGADSQGVGLKNFDVWADQLHKDFPWAFSDRDGSKDESAIFDFFASDPPAIPKASDPELQDKFWAAVTPEYKKHLEMMRMGEVPLEHLDLSQQMGDDMRDWEAHRRANDNFSAFQDALVERFSVFWQSSGGMNGRQAGKQRNPSLTV